jgi:hypothetical protein
LLFLTVADLEFPYVFVPPFNWDEDEEAAAEPPIVEDADEACKLRLLLRDC